LDSTVLTAIISAVSVAVGLVASKLIDAFNAWRKERREDDGQEHKQEMEDKKQAADLSIPINEQAVGVYRELVQGLRADLAKLSAQMSAQDLAYLQAREDKAVARAELDSVRRENESIKAELVAVRKENQTLRDDNSALNRKLDVLQARVDGLEKAHG